MTVNTEPLKQALRDHARVAVDLAVQDQMIPASKEAAQVRTGAMREGIHADPAQDLGDTIHTTVYSDATYSSFMDAGTAPHRIDGNPLLSFHWEKIGRNVVFRFVNHPGTVGSNFFDLTLEDHFEPALVYGLEAAP